MSNSNDNLNEQPTQMAPSGSHETAAEGQQTWQSGQSNQGDGLGSQFANNDANESATRAMPQDAGNAQQGQQYSSAPGQYPPVPGSTPHQQASGAQQYGSNGNQQYGSQPQNAGYGSSPQGGQQGAYNQGGQNGQYNSTGQQYGSYGQNQPQQGQQNYGNYNSAGQPSYGSNTPAGGYAGGQQAGAMPTYDTNGQQYGQGASQPYSTDQGTTKTPARGGLGKTLGWGALAGALLAVIGVFGTWMWVKVDAGSFGNFNASTNGIGMESTNAPSSAGSTGDKDKVTDGWFVLIPALIVLALGVLRALGKVRKPVMWAGAAMGAIATGVAIYDYFDIKDKLDEIKGQATSLGGFSAGSGWGLTLCMIGGIVMLVTCVMSALRD